MITNGLYEQEAGTADRFPAERLADCGRNPATDRHEWQRSRYPADRMPQRQLGRRSQRQLVRCAHSSLLSNRPRNFIKVSGLLIYTKTEMTL